MPLTRSDRALFLKAIEAGDIDQVRNLREEHGAGLCDLTANGSEAIVLACVYERLEILEYFRTSWDILPTTFGSKKFRQFLSYSTTYGDAKCHTEIRDNWKVYVSNDELRPDDIFDAMARYSRFGKLLEIAALQVEPYVSSSCSSRKAEVIELLKELLYMENDIPSLLKVFEKIISLWHLKKDDIFSYRADVIYPPQESVFDIAIARGRIPLLELFYRLFNLTVADIRREDKRSLRTAAMSGQAEVLKHLCHTWHLTPKDARARDNAALISAASEGHAGVLKVLREDYGLTIDDARANSHAAFKMAAENGHVEVIQEFRDWGLNLRDLMFRNYELLYALMRTRIIKESPEKWETDDDSDDYTSSSYGSSSDDESDSAPSDDAVSDLSADGDLYDVLDYDEAEAALALEASHRKILIEILGWYPERMMEDLTFIALEAKMEFAEKMYEKWESALLKMSLTIRFSKEEYEHVENITGAKELVPSTCSVCTRPLFNKCWVYALGPNALKTCKTDLTVTKCGHIGHKTCIRNRRLLSKFNCPTCWKHKFATKKRCANVSIPDKTDLTDAYKTLKAHIVMRSL